MRILTTIGLAVAVIALAGCGGSSYLSESPGEGDNVSTATLSAVGIVGPNRDSTSKDVILDPVEGITGGSGDSYLDAGMHSCWFEVESSDDSVVGVDDGDFQTCSDPFNCAVCTIVNGDPVGDPDCSIYCAVNVIPRPAVVGVKLNILYGDDIVFWTDAEGSSGGAVRVDGLASPSGTHLFDPTSVQFFTMAPEPAGIIIAPGGVPDLYRADVTTADVYSRVYNISDTVLDPLSDVNYAGLPANVAWGLVFTSVPLEIDLSNLAVPGTSETYDGGSIQTNAGMWHDAANNVSTVVGVPD